MRGMAIRKMEIDDLHSVFELGNALFTDIETARPWSDLSLAEHYGKFPELCLVAAVKKRIAGFIIGARNIDKNTGKTSGQVLWFGIDPGQSRHETLTGLFDALKEEMKAGGAEHILAQSPKGKLGMSDFYARMGFSPAEELLTLRLDL
jgi:ribosomal protein S18 acetylase RimI-like enzyme